MIHPSIGRGVRARQRRLGLLAGWYRSYESSAKPVIVVGAESAASARLVAVCSECKLWGSIVARVAPGYGRLTTLSQA